MAKVALRAIASACLFVSVISPALAQQDDQADRMLFQNYPAEARFFGAGHAPDFKGRDRAYSSYRTRIRNALRNGPNFDNNYTVIEVGCGTGCIFVLVTSIIDGRTIELPENGEERQMLTLSYRKDSSGLAAYWQNDGKCWRETFVLSRSKLTSLSKTEMHPCSAPTSQESDPPSMSAPSTGRAEAQLPVWTDRDAGAYCLVSLGRDFFGWGGINCKEAEKRKRVSLATEWDNLRPDLREACVTGLVRRDVKSYALLDECISDLAVRDARRRRD